MITFKELRRKLAEANIQFYNVFESLEDFLLLAEESTFYIYRTDTNSILARGVQGFEQAKKRASELRKRYKLTFDQVRFRTERRTASKASPKGSGGTFTNAYGQRYPIEYSRHVNPSKRSRFRGYTDSDGNFHDLD